MSAKPTYLVCGDMHGSLDAARYVIDKAGKLGIKTIIQVGDWGFVWPSSDISKTLDSCLKAAGVFMHFIDGNHDWHEKLPNVSAKGGYTNLGYLSRGTVKAYADGDGTSAFLFVGGAASYDTHMRTTGKDWFDTEELTLEQTIEAIDNARKVEAFHGAKIACLFTHEAPEMPPGRIDSDNNVPYWVYERCKEGRKKIANIAYAVKPELHIHGHWHQAYDTKTIPGWATRTIGLNIADSDGGMVVLDQTGRIMEKDEKTVFVSYWADTCSSCGRPAVWGAFNCSCTGLESKEKFLSAKKVKK